MSNGIGKASFNNIPNLKLDSINKVKNNNDSISELKSVEKKPTLNFENKLDFSVRKNIGKLPEFKPTINFLPANNPKLEEKSTIKDSINLEQLNNSVNIKLANDILKQAIAQ